MKNRVARISKLLNNLKRSILAANVDLETVMTNAFEVAAVTEVENNQEQQLEPIHKSSYLKDFRSQFLSAIDKKLQEHGMAAKTSQKRIQSNLIFDIYKQGKKYNTLFVSLVTNKKNYCINFRYDFWYFAKADIQPFEAALKSEKEFYSGMKERYLEARENIDKIELPQGVKIWEGMSINEAHYRPKLTRNSDINISIAWEISFCFQKPTIVP